MAPQMVQTIGIQYKNMSLIIKKNTTFKIPRTGIIQAFLPSSLGGLSLWLKADAGVTLGISQIIISGFTGIYTGANGTYNYNIEENYWFHSSTSYYINQNGSLIDDNDQTVIATNNNNFQGAWTPTNYLSTITLSNAGEDADQGGVVVNGTYTRSDASLPNGPFSASGGRSITYDDNEAGFWSTNGDYYRNYANLAVNGWAPQNGEEPAPTAVNSNSVRNVGSPTSTTVLDLVTAWADQSGNGIVLTPDIQNAPTFVSSFLNGKPAIEFIVGSNTGLSNTSFGLTGFTFFSVTKQKPTNTGRIFSSYFGNVLIGTWGSYSNRFYGGGDNGWLAEGEETSTDFLITTAFSDANTSFGFYQNGILQSNGDSNSTVILNGISVGGGIWNGGNEEASDSYVCEIVIYNRTLSLTERQQVEAYLNQKYQIY